MGEPAPAGSPASTMENFDARNAPAEQPLSLAEAVSAIVEEAQATEAEPPPIDTSRPNIVKPVKIALGGKERLLSFPFWALMKFEDETGISPWDHEKAWGYPPSLKTLTTMLWCALLEHDESITLDQVRRFPELTLSNTLYVRGRLNELWGMSNPPADPNAPAGEGAADPNAVAASTG